MIEAQCADEVKCTPSQLISALPRVGIWIRKKSSSRPGSMLTGTPYSSRLNDSLPNCTWCMEALTSCVDVATFRS
ncbi:hypothetical protein KPSA3_04629 [Pseudomonas syringae pv. actinidiae]|uniref:Uncharacterized protein n=1 Tax=Pseudomonas syringae pv. actinidiae TaxID=103796 RepID=A0AAN4Q808_PSESF|nr:hypothetical protein KPSA3_04629 [Pseudomonas syringae pv. actinidiae]